MATLGDVLRAVRADDAETAAGVAEHLGMDTEAAARALVELRAAGLLKHGSRRRRTLAGALAQVAARAARADGADLPPTYQPYRGVQDEHTELLARVVA